MPDVVAHLLAPDGAIPNHPRWPLLIYPGAVAIAGPDPALAFEEMFKRNRWPAAWRNGVYPFHHFHSTGHEALGIYEGEVTVQFGGDAGVSVTARPGDVIVLPAGTGHKRLSASPDFEVVGAYPEGRDWDLIRADDSDRRIHDEAVTRIAKVPKPAYDPVTGKDGPLARLWA